MKIPVRTIKSQIEFANNTFNKGYSVQPNDR